MTATGWCEDCGDVDVEPMCVSSRAPAWVTIWHEDSASTCCAYADCSRCGEDVDQWAWV